MKKYLFIILGLFIGTVAQAQTMIVKPDPEKMLRKTPIQDLKTKLAPVVSEISSTSAKVSLPKDYPRTTESRSQFYFEYGEQIACPAIYPMPEYCKPKVTEKNGGEAILKDLKPGKKYFVSFVKDSDIKCITTPCPTNGFRSSFTEFETLGATSTITPNTSTTSPKFIKNLRYGSRGIQVVDLQNFLFEKGYMTSSSTGFYGKETEKAIRKYQKDMMKISPTGTTGQQTWIHMFGIK